MAEKKNQHYIPQFFFRNFSENNKHINLLIKSKGITVHNVSIKNQCSENYFYGSKENEELISQIELVGKDIMDSLESVRKIGILKNDFSACEKRDENLMNS